MYTYLMYKLFSLSVIAHIFSRDCKKRLRKVRQHRQRKNNNTVRNVGVSPRKNVLFARIRSITYSLLQLTCIFKKKLKCNVTLGERDARHDRTLGNPLAWRFHSNTEELSFVLPVRITRRVVSSTYYRRQVIRNTPNYEIQNIYLSRSEGSKSVKNAKQI